MSGESPVLGRQIARGGEGAIHEVVGRPDLVAKRYHQPPDAQATAKLRALVALAPRLRHCCVAWPRELLEEGGRISGFLMPRITGRHDLHRLSAPTARRNAFPTADYRFLVATAANLARAVAQVHAAGHVIGDINDRFAMVGGDATVMLLDADSYQIETGAARFACNVAQLPFQPPELQGISSWRGLVRHRNHDCFGLAVLIFQLLFLNRHPFAGRPLQGDVPEISAAIRDHKFAFGSAARARGLVAPPHALSLADVGAKAARYFEIAFAPPAPGSGTDRPTAADWAAALDELNGSLRRCTVNDGHWHLGARCPLCAIEAAIGTLLFLPRTGTGEDAAEAARRMWAQIGRVTPPVPWGELPEPAMFRAGLRATPYPAPRPPQTIWQRLGNHLGLWRDRAIAAERARRHDAARGALAAWREAAAGWGRSDPGAQYAAQRAALTAACDRLAALSGLRAQKLAALQAQARARQLHAHLERFELADARIPGIGPARRATLEAAGFETAADCTEAKLQHARMARRLPGLGPAKLHEIMQWRAQLERGFTFDPARLVTAGDLQQLNGEMARDQKQLLAQLEQGVQQLRSLARQASAEVAAARDRLTELARAAAQAECDRDAPLPA